MKPIPIMQMLAAPSWKRTMRIMQTELIFAPIALSYLVLLLQSLQPDTIQLLLPGSLEAGLQGGQHPASSSQKDCNAYSTAGHVCACLWNPAYHHQACLPDSLHRKLLIQEAYLICRVQATIYPQPPGCRHALFTFHHCSLALDSPALDQSFCSK